MSGGTASTGASSGGSSRRAARRGAVSQDFELNLASIIDCFVVLIAFILVSTSFVAVGILDAGASAGGAQVSQNPPPIRVEIRLAANQGIELKVSGKAKSSSTFAPKGNERDYDKMGAQLAAIKHQWPSLTSATLVADNSVGYRDVVQAMEVARKSVPGVLLGGF